MVLRAHQVMQISFAERLGQRIATCRVTTCCRQDEESGQAALQDVSSFKRRRAMPFAPRP
jgi:hypothetical protein